MAYSEDLAERIRDAIGDRPGVRERKMFRGRPLGGFILVDTAGIVEDHELGRWVDAGADHAETLPPK